MSHTSRIILLIDMDCFYCQVEENLDPSLKGKPLAVVQYNQWRGGGIIAVNYPARDKGVTRHMRGNDAKEKCPEIILVKVPEVRGKANLSKYRDAGKRVADVLQTFTSHLERASVDEAYLDITSVVEKRIQENNDHVTMEKLLNTFVVGNSTSDFIENVTRHRTYDESNFKLALGGVVAEEIREEVYNVTGYRCSAGIAHNKILAKLVCGLHKPNKQTILPHEAVPELYENMPIRKIKSLGGKFGNTVVEKLGIENMGELIKFSQKELAKAFDEKSASWLYNIARGIDSEPVNTRLVAKSIGCSKKFPGKTALCKKEDIEHWLNELSEEMFERLEKDLEENGRKGRQMVVNFAQEIGDEEIHGRKSHPLNLYEPKRIFDNAFKIIEKNCLKDDGSYRVTLLSISVGNFQDVKKVKEITSFFKNMREHVKKESVVVEVASSKNMDDAEDASDDSIYSQTTEEGDDVDDNLIRYEQVHPDSIANQSDDVLEIDNGSDVFHDSISSEVLIPANSFFSKYFGAKTENMEEIIEVVDDQELTSAPNEATSVNAQIIKTDNACPHCGKMIDNIADYETHLDYHFAISIVKDEAHLYKRECKPASLSPMKNTGKKRRKDVSSSSSHKVIGDYFKNDLAKEEEEDKTKDVCRECNKQIALSEWDIHMDYHAAKKLHLEMNVKQSEVVKRKSVKTKFKGQKNILGFLKSS